MDVLSAAVRGALDASENATPAQAVEAVTRQLATALGASAVALMIADLSGRALVRLTELDLHGSPASAYDVAVPKSSRQEAGEAAKVLPFDGGPAEQALRTQAIQVLAPGSSHAAGSVAGRWTVIAPISERGDTAGLLEMSLPTEPSPDVLDEIGRTAHLLAFVLIAARRHTDLFEWGQRTTPFTLAAEIQRRLLPPAFTCEGGMFTLSAWVEPAESVGGDTFDYSAARDHLRLSLTDAMGHGVDAALAATLCVGSLRSSRRHGGSLVDQAHTANNAMTENAATLATDIYVTGLLGELDLQTGLLSLVNAGHAAPFLAPADGGSPYSLQLRVDPPFGMFPDSNYGMTQVQLVAGDRLVFITDGMTERNAADLDLPKAILATRSLHPREATRALADAVLDAAGGQLSDDATLMVLDWHEVQDGKRTTTSGADPETASDPLP